MHLGTLGTLAAVSLLPQGHLEARPCSAGQQRLLGCGRHLPRTHVTAFSVLMLCGDGHSSRRGQEGWSISLAGQGGGKPRGQDSGEDR